MSDLSRKAKRKMGRVMQLASFSMAEVTYATGDIAYLVQEQAKSATFRVKARQDNVSGVILPAFEVDRVPGNGAPLSPPADFPSRRGSLMCRPVFKQILTSRASAAVGRR